MTVFVRKDPSISKVVFFLGSLRTSTEAYDVILLTPLFLIERLKIVVSVCRLRYIDFSADCGIDCNGDYSSDYHCRLHSMNNLARIEFSG